MQTYADVEVGDVCVFFGSTEQLEMAVRNGSAAVRLGAGPGAAVDVVWR